jgi:predicted RNA-binding Zn-ribbon protein involved in translation (DUF1610 family)
MRWLLHGKTRTRRVKGGRVLDEKCPECGEEGSLREVEVTTSAGAFFVDVVSSTDRAFACGSCGEVFDLRDDAAPAPAADAAAPARPARDLLAELEAERVRRDAARADRDRKVEDELAELKRRLGK